jgi:polysaccharide export outer membrane protein
LVATSGCRTTTPTQLTEQDTTPDRSIILREGDVIHVAFPGAPNLNTTQQIRRDGNITMSSVGDVKAVGLTPAELEKELLKLYETQLVTKEVVVTLDSSSFYVFVTGAVLRPGKVSAVRPLTALEAIMEAGGAEPTRANLKAVVVIRHEEKQVRNFTLDLKPALEGKKSQPFYLHPSDIVYVPEKFSWF